MKTAMQDTSLEAYRDLTPTLGARQATVYHAFQVLCGVRPFNATDWEATRYLGWRDPNRVRPRRFELVKLGLVWEDGKRECRVTKRTVIAWRLNYEQSR